MSLKTTTTRGQQTLILQFFCWHFKGTISLKWVLEISMAFYNTFCECKAIFNCHFITCMFLVLGCLQSFFNLLLHRFVLLLYSGHEQHLVCSSALKLGVLYSEMLFYMHLAFYEARWNLGIILWHHGPENGHLQENLPVDQQLLKYSYFFGINNHVMFKVT